jgi:hypothetical protein
MKGAEMKSSLRTSDRFELTVTLLCCFVVIFLCAASPLRALTLAETARLLPSETVLLIEVGDFNRLREQFEKTNLYELYKDPAMGPFFEDVKTKWRNRPQMKKDKGLGLLAGIDALPEGRAAFAVVFNERLKDANEPPIVLIVQWGQNINKAKEAVDKTVKKVVEEGDHRRSENYRGAEITTIIRDSSKSYHFCFIEDCLIAAADIEILKFVIAHIEGAASPALADDDGYSETMRRIELGDAEQIDCFVNIKQIIKMAIAADDKNETATIIRNVGLDNVGSFGFSLGLGALPGASAGSSSGKAYLKIRGRKQGLMKMFEVESAPLRTPGFLPSSAYAVSFVNLNFQNLYSELVRVLTSFSPQLAAMMYMPLIPASPQGEPPVQIKAGIIDHLGSQIVIAQSIDESRPGAGAAGQETSVVAIATENRIALEKSLSLLHGKILAANNPDARRQLLGHTIYVLDFKGFLPGLKSPPKQPMQSRYGRGAAQAAVPPMPKFAFTVTDTHLIISTEAAVEKAIRTLNSSENISIENRRWFNTARSAVPSLVGLATLQNDALSGKFIWSQLRNLPKRAAKKDKDSSIEMGVGVRPGSSFPQMMLTSSGSDLFDFSLLPEFDEVKKHFGLSALYGISRADGFFFEFKYLNRQQED